MHACSGQGKLPETVPAGSPGDLPRLAGIDVQAGMISVNNNWQLYRKLLDNFHRRNRDLISEIQTELKRGNSGAARRLAHTVKGVAGTLGAQKLSAISSRLEAAIRTGNHRLFPELLNDFAQELNRVLAALGDFIDKEGHRHTPPTPSVGEPGTPRPESLDIKTIKKRFQQLSELIDKRDSDVIQLVAEIKTLLNPLDISASLLKLESQLNSFRFEQAKATLEQATNELDF